MESLFQNSELPFSNFINVEKLFHYFIRPGGDNTDYHLFEITTQLTEFKTRFPYINAIGLPNHMSV